MTAEPHAAHDVDFEKAQPVRVGDLFEGLGFEDAETINQNLNIVNLLIALRTPSAVPKSAASLVTEPRTPDRARESRA